MKDQPRRVNAQPHHVPELLVQEYVSLRNESLSAKQNQQTILQWTLATVGIVVAASIAAVSALKDLDALGRFGLNCASAVLLGALIPIVVSCAFGIWLGELQRMERAGRFLREREVAWSGGAASWANPDDPQYGFMLLWESLLVDDTRRRGYPKNRIGGAASIALFLTLSMFSLLAGATITLGPGGLSSNLPPGLSPTVVFWIVGGWVAIFLTANVSVFVRPVYDLARSSTVKNTSRSAWTKSVRHIV